MFAGISRALPCICFTLAGIFCAFGRIFVTHAKLFFTPLNIFQILFGIF